MRLVSIRPTSFRRLALLLENGHHRICFTISNPPILESLPGNPRLISHSTSKMRNPHETRSVASIVELRPTCQMGISNRQLPCAIPKPGPGGSTYDGEDSAVVPGQVRHNLASASCKTLANLQPCRYSKTSPAPRLANPVPARPSITNASTNR